MNTDEFRTFILIKIFLIKNRITALDINNFGILILHIRIAFNIYDIDVRTVDLAYQYHLPFR